MNSLRPFPTNPATYRQVSVSTPSGACITRTFEVNVKDITIERLQDLASDLGDLAKDTETAINELMFIKKKLAAAEITLKYLIKEVGNV